MNKIFLIFGAVLLIGIMFASSYVPPIYNQINFTLGDGYTAPIYSSINFTLADSESCASQTNGVWYVPSNCTCYKETSATQIYLNLDDWIRI